MAIARQTIQPQNHFFESASFCTFKKYKMIITTTAINKELTKKVAPSLFETVAAIA